MIKNGMAGSQIAEQGAYAALEFFDVGIKQLRGPLIYTLLPLAVVHAGNVDVVLAHPLLNGL
jgi:hypothetical protein